MKNKILLAVICVGIMLMNIPIQVGFYDQYQQYLNKTTAQRLGIAAALAATAYFAYRYARKTMQQEESLPQNGESQPQEEQIEQVVFDDPNYFNYLGVESTASKAAIHGAYKKKSLQWHPDKYMRKHSGKPGRAKYANAMFNHITKTRDFLLNDAIHQHYKAWLKEWLANPTFNDCDYYKYLNISSYAQDKHVNEGYEKRKKDLEGQLDTEESIDEWNSTIKQLLLAEKAYYILRNKDLRQKYYTWRLSPASGCK